jgi:hypothetical protein
VGERVEVIIHNLHTVVVLHVLEEALDGGVEVILVETFVLDVRQDDGAHKVGELLPDLHLGIEDGTIPLELLDGEVEEEEDEVPVFFPLPRGKSTGPKRKRKLGCCLKRGLQATKHEEKL